MAEPYSKWKENGLPDHRHHGAFNAAISDETFSRFKTFVESEIGIKMPDAKKTMVQSRLMKRLRALGKQSFEEYCAYVFSAEGRRHEMVHLIDAITTNKTDFFREPKHFSFLVEKVLRPWAGSRRIGNGRMVRFWSAGCSTGEEPYTLAMVLSEFAVEHPEFRFTILATDISTRVLETAKLAIYDQQRVAPVAMEMRKKYLMRSKDRNASRIRIVPRLRSAITWRRLNFMDEDYGTQQPMDVIFCRNVLIYFDRPTQERVLNRLCRCLVPGGFLFMGHSENLNGLDVPVEPVGATVYRKPG